MHGRGVKMRGWADIQVDRKLTDEQENVVDRHEEDKLRNMWE